MCVLIAACCGGIGLFILEIATFKLGFRIVKKEREIEQRIGRRGKGMRLGLMGKILGSRDDKFEMAFVYKCLGKF